MNKKVKIKKYFLMITILMIRILKTFQKINQINTKTETPEVNYNKTKKKVFI